MNAGGSTYQENTVIRTIPTQGNAPAADTSNKVTQGNDDDACPERKFSGTSQRVPCTDENTAQTPVTEQSNLIHDHFPAPSPYDTPYPTVYDPTGHYARVYNRLLCSSPSEQPKIESDEEQSLPSKAAHRRFVHPQYRDSTHFTAYGPSNNGCGKHGTASFTPETYRFTGHDSSQSQDRSNYLPSSPEFGQLEGINHSVIRAPLPKPVVIGHIVHQGRKHVRVEDDEEYMSPLARRRVSPFRRVPIRIDNTNYSTTNNSQRDVDSGQGISDVDAPHPRGYDITSTRRRREDSYGDDNDGDRSYMPDDDSMQGSDSELFMPQNGPHNSRHPSRTDRPSKSGIFADAQVDASVRSIPEYYHSHRPGSRRGTNPEGYFHAFGQRLDPSRYSGVPMPWEVANEPELVDQSEVSDASLLKRNLARGEGKKICRRGYGASDPENIAIVNMKEFDNLSFDEIARRLNDQRVREGKQPSLSAVGVNSRYNRTAPLLFSAQGKEFIPLSKRKGHAKQVHEANKGGMILWTEELDVALVTCVKDVDAAKWTTVATLFEERTGKKLNAAAAALRHNLL
ncbi:hypothetical protein OIDMADRAFT_23256 [Oidiodendron maius Zn]|uniref:Uncharacterized protein n=1 Tax=Oidiodendron maius (strain Zn) TaxID=913774 RepID=A0A0C3HJR7_OIDMZ|nr:hypothetical protein OIDMADRAFT_23256 [Oidiodendron maius Zn]